MSEKHQGDQFHQKFGVYGVQMYDEAMVKKMEKFLNNVVFAPTDEAFDEAARREGDNKDKVQLPLISIFRSGFRLNGALKNTPETVGMGRYVNPRRRAQMNAALANGDDPDKILGKLREDKECHPYGVTANTMPVILTYQIDIWGRRRDIVDDLTCNMLFYLAMEPNITTINPSDGEEVTLSFGFEDEVVDNSEKNAANDMGKVIRDTIIVTLDVGRIYLVRETPMVLKPQIEFEIIPYKINKEREDDSGV